MIRSFARNSDIRLMAVASTASTDGSGLIEGYLAKIMQ